MQDEFNAIRSSMQADSWLDDAGLRAYKTKKAAVACIAHTDGADRKMLFDLSVSYGMLSDGLQRLRQLVDDPEALADEGEDLFSVIRSEVERKVHEHASGRSSD